jgi:hypothetical protein
MAAGSAGGHTAGPLPRRRSGFPLSGGYAWNPIHPPQCCYGGRASLSSGHVGYDCKAH